MNLCFIINLVMSFHTIINYSCEYLWKVQRVFFGELVVVHYQVFHRLHRRPRVCMPTKVVVVVAIVVSLV